MAVDFIPFMFVSIPVADRITHEKSAIRCHPTPTSTLASFDSNTYLLQLGTPPLCLLRLVEAKERKVGTEKWAG